MLSVEPVTVTDTRKVKKRRKEDRGRKKGVSAAS